MKSIIFDFDGVLVDSVSIKIEAFFKVFEDISLDFANHIKEYHLKTNKNRFEVIRYATETLGYNNSFYLNKIEQFKSIVARSVVEADEIVGAKEFLNQCYQNKIDMYVISGTPQDELSYIIEEKRWSYFFKEQLGTPIKKDIHCIYLMDKYNLSSDDLVFFGDMMSDYKVAKAYDIGFIGVGKNEFPVDTIKVINDFNDINIQDIL